MNTPSTQVSHSLLWINKKNSPFLLKNSSPCVHFSPFRGRILDNEGAKQCNAGGTRIHRLNYNNDQANLPVMEPSAPVWDWCWACFECTQQRWMQTATLYKDCKHFFPSYKSTVYQMCQISSYGSLSPSVLQVPPQFDTIMVTYFINMELRSPEEKPWKLAMEEIEEASWGSRVKCCI